MKIHNVAQGSAEWHALRAKYFTASEAPAMMGASKYQSRTELLTAKKTGITPEVNPQMQRIFDRGHATEATSRPLVEQKIGEELYPIVGTSGNLLASMDGATMLGDTLFEHKLWNESLVAQVRAGELEPHYYWQLEQQLLVSGAERVIFVCSDGTAEKFVSMEYRPVAGRAAQLVEGWKQFETDLAGHSPAEIVAEEAGVAPDNLPALRIEVTGMVTASNLEQFKAHSLAVIGAINTNLQTDKHFADADETVKWCSEVESKLAAAKQHALSQTESIELLFRTIDQISKQTREKRLELEKLVKARKVAIRDEIVMTAQAALRKHIDQINASLGGRVTLPQVAADFAGVIKGKKSIVSLRDAADSELARAKIDASQKADAIRLNLSSLAELAVDHNFLFNDLQQLIFKANDDLVTLIKVRINEHKQAEAKKEEAQRERIREEEAAKLKDAEEAKRKDAEVEANVKTAAPVIAATPVEKTAARMTAVPPSAKVPPKPTKLQANVTDLEALVQAVAAGKAPISVLTVNWQNLDDLVDSQGAAFTMPGVTLEQVAA